MPPTGRFAPSPTAALHLGNLRTALLAWLFARAGGGRFLVRVEDLDPVASRPELARGQLDDLAAIGLDWDGPVVFQSARRELHEAALAQLVERGLTYPCFCTRREVREAAQAAHGTVPGGFYPGTCRHLDEAEVQARLASGRRAALRLRSDGVPVTVTDALHGTVSGVVDDVVLRRNDGVPAYSLAVVVDDADQGVDQVVRGDDLLHATPTQARIADLLGLPRPTWAHVPLVLGADGRRLAKRHGAVTLGELRAAGATPDEVRSWLAASVGLCEPGEPVSPAELVARFDPARLPLEAGVVDVPLRSADR